MRRLSALIATALVGLTTALGGAVPGALADTSGQGSTTGAVPSAAQIIATAEMYIGYPYAYIGDDPSNGFSCIGFAHFVFAQNGVYVPEDLGTAYASAPHVDRKDLQPGDLIFFKDTLWDGLSHVALYVGNGKMIGADSFQTGVQWDSLGDAYWQEHYLGATRPLADPSGTLVDPNATPVPSGPSLAPPSGPTLAIKAGTALTPRHDATIYSGPGYSYVTIDTVSPTDALTVVQTHGQWVNVSYDGGSKYGWIAGSDVSTAPPSSQRSGSQPTPAPGASPTPSAGPAGTTGTPTTTPRPAITAAPVPRSVAVSAARRDDTGKTLVVMLAAELYTGPASSYQALTRLDRGATVTVLHTQGQWDQVELSDGTAGWIGRDHLNAPSHDAAARPSAGHPAQGQGQEVAGFHATRGYTVAVTADALYVRAAPSIHARILGRVYAGDHLRVLTAGRTWDYVALHDASRGWVSALYVR